MLWTGKGNVQRKQTVKEYEREIQNVVSVGDVQKESYYVCSNDQLSTCRIDFTDHGALCTVVVYQKEPV